MTASLTLAVLIGIGFGAALEQAGLGHAPKLAGQFYFRDFSVFKVMFSAIVTALLGTFWLSRLGFMDLSALFIPTTFLLPQLVGGLIFGAGFALAGLCPGTSCVAAASGRGDGFAVIGGMFAGMLGAGLVFPQFAAFYTNTDYGALTLPQWLNLPYGVVVGAIVLIALAAFALIERLEKKA